MNAFKPTKHLHAANATFKKTKKNFIESFQSRNLGNRINAFGHKPRAAAVTENYDLVVPLEQAICWA